MNRLGVVAGVGSRGVHPRTLVTVMPCLGLLIALLLLPTAAARASSPYIWDDNEDGMDDRMESVHALGFAFAFENADTLARQRIEVRRTPANLVYGAYVIFGQAPTPSNLASLQALGLPILFRYESVPAVRTAGSFAQLRLAAALPGVLRIEATPILYSLVRESAASIGRRDATERVFPTWEGTGGGDGTGVVVAILDTGVNDESDGVVTGHESLIGRFVGGATFPGPDSTLGTPRDGSLNPSDHGGAATKSHATHIAGIVLGSGGEDGYAKGIAPGARFVDVKVLGDAGSGTGLPEGLDWCIHNRSRDWGVPGYAGIRVINLSLGSVDQSDGNDLASRLAERAVELGIVVVASIGNDGLPAHVPSPAAGDGVITVGAYDAQRSPEAGDDFFASFSNRGPRAGDGDADASDEQKPDLLAPGVAVLAPNGDPGSDGRQYRRLSGTSMSAAVVSGAVACLRSAYPALGPAAILERLHSTARRDLSGVPSGPSGVDPRWHAARGFGVLDLYAAKLEFEQPGLSQMVRLELRPATNLSAVQATLWVQRARSASHFAIERATDAGGAPGPFAVFDSLAASGDSSLAGLVNRSSYGFLWPVPPAERGQAFWYRAAFSEGGGRVVTPARRLVSPDGPGGPGLATLEWTIVHNALDHDLTGSITGGSSSATAFSARGAQQYPITIALPGTSAAVSSDWVDGASTFGNVAWSFRVEVSDPSASAVLPPAADKPWRLVLDEGGYLNRSGRVTRFRVTWHGPGGDQVFEGAPVPQQTVEGGEITAVIPAMLVGVEPLAGGNPLRYGPNPLRGQGSVMFELQRETAREVRIFDLAGREIGRAPFVSFGSGSRAEWRALNRNGGSLAPGVYLARIDERASVRFAVLAR